MMDSQEKTLEKGTQEMEQVENSVTKTASAPMQEAEVERVDTEATSNTYDTEENTSVRKSYKTKEEILARITDIVANNENPQKEEIDYLKTTFYKIHLAEREVSMKDYLENGGDPEQYKVLPDPKEEAFKAQMQVVKERRAKLFQEQEQEKQDNLKKKLDIIEKLKAMATSPDAANKAYHEFKELQQQWKEIKAVPAEKASELWRSYQLYVEQFYDLLKLNNEAREYDFKKNLELKEKLCEAAEKLADEADVVSAFHQLQELHAEYREIGPVAKELREKVWIRFKTASTIVNKRHQQHFEDLRAAEEENLVKKTALCEKVEAIAQQEMKTANDWEERTKEILNIQNEWKTIGFAPQKMNVKIFDRFRGACDEFFTRKSEFFKELKKLYAENVQKKKNLVEQAQALADSTDWKATGDALVALQKEWKTIGMVPRKLGDQLWNDFLTACNKFFDARNQANSGTRNAERENLTKKRDILEQLKTFMDETIDDAQDKVRELVDTYNKIGHVPFKEKDKLYEEYRAVVDEVYKKLNMSVARKRLDDFKANLKNVAKRGADAIDNERGKLIHRYEALKQEIITYENNLGFLTASSKKGNSLLDEMNRKVQKLKDELELVKQKVKEIDKQNRDTE